MTFTSEQLKALENPYQALIETDKLAEHQEQLDRLSAQEKKDLAIKLVLNCPEKELTHLGHAIKALKAPSATEDSFQYVVNQVWEIRKKILALKNPHHLKPHTLLLKPEFNADIFAEFNDFSLNFLDGNELSIAQKLAKTTPKEQRNELVRNIQNAFPDSQFVTVIGATFAFRRELDVLLGDEPYRFFISPEFNAKAYVRYDELLELIDGKDEEIAAKLASTPNLKRFMTLTHMELMFPGSILLEKTKEAFKAPAKETVHGGSMFPPAAAVTDTPKPKKEEAQASLICGT